MSKFDRFAEEQSYRLRHPRPEQALLRAIYAVRLGLAQRRETPGGIEVYADGRDVIVQVYDSHPEGGRTPSESAVVCRRSKAAVRFAKELHRTALAMADARKGWYA